jgi:hypothetical protein
MRSRLRLALGDKPDFPALRALWVTLAEVDSPHELRHQEMRLLKDFPRICLSAAASQGAAARFLPPQPLEALARPLIRAARETSRAPGIRPLARQAPPAQPTAPRGKAAAQAVVVAIRLSQTLVAVPNGAAAAVVLVGITTRRLLLSRPLPVD